MGGFKYEVDVKTTGEVQTNTSFENDTLVMDIIPLEEHKGNITILSAEVRIPYNFSVHDKLLLNGYQSWTDVHELGIHDRMRGLHRLPRFLAYKYSLNRYGDYDFVKYPYKNGYMHGFSYAYIRQQNDFLLIGSISEQNGFTVIIFDVNKNQIILQKDVANLEISGSYRLFEVLFTRGHEDEVFRTWYERMGLQKREIKPIFGYTSWYNHYQNINQTVIMKNLEGIANFEKKMDIFQIDDGYQTAVGDWLSVDKEKFPDGMENICDEIHKRGLVAGIWLAPFVCEKNSDIYRNHQDYLLKHDGENVTTGCNWSGSYALDLENVEVRRYIKYVFEVVLNKWHFDLVKLDFLYAACIYPTKTKSRGQLMCEAVDFLREIVGDKLILGCGVPLHPAFGKFDYCRIGCDMGLDWNGKGIMKYIHRERVSTKNAVLNAMFMRQLDGYVYGNDPDVFLLRNDNIRLTKDQKTTVAKVNALCGSVLFVSDDVSEYDEEQKAIYREVVKLSEAEVIDADVVGHVACISYRYKDSEPDDIQELRFDI